MSVYEGRRGANGIEVTVDGRPLDPRLDLRVFSESGFEWGYDGGGPAQLALAILAHHFGDDVRAMTHYKDFRSAVVAGLTGDTWRLEGDIIEGALGSVTVVPMTLEQLLDKVRGKT